MSRIAVALAIVAALLGGLSCAQAGVVVTVDKTAQRLSVTVNGANRYDWPVSTARIGYRTPNGSYRPERLERQWYSRRYDWSPMPHSIFFSGGYAIHGSYEISRLGRPASHGCIRLHPQHAATLYALVKERVNDTRIVVTGGDGPSMAVARVPARVTAQESYSSRHSTRDSRESRPPARTIVETRRSHHTFADVFYDRPRR
jgi:L,D-transpeptidase catalytic domain